MPFEINLFRNPEKDYNQQLDVLTKKGWIIVTEPVKTIKTSMFTKIRINPGDGTLLKKSENSKLKQRTMRRSLASGKVSIYSSPYVFLPRRSIREVLNKHNAGSIVAVWDYE